ncbi:hypothetical protein Herbaro_18990 [Herbaspirillum sp. WKF16]|uniref:hypothetical protein n=1 Tax=Herbaspirillum sp. WKF16 TaxID=3028312 RepID=UPI0023A9EC6C|nr:hypothetical protein [Herbaspirillum sp. WKF16]WDZ95544.1 hypothetical protein Herbaro_18990 [Herbaspirillum sp. WKF16]
MAAAPWWQPAFARGAQDIPAMALCSAGSGGAPAHLAAGHCQLCCGSQLPQSLPESGPAAAIASGASYPLAPAGLAERSASLAPGAARARAPPAA